MQNHIVCHYGEIALKGKNRDFFENTLIQNIKNQLLETNFKNGFTVEKRFGKIIISFIENKSTDREKISSTLQNIFGLTSFSFATKIEQDIEKIKKTSLKILQDRNFKTFRITTKRSQKNFPLNSEQTNREIGAYIIEKMHKDVLLKNPDITCFVEISENYAFVYTEKIKGSGGMPVSTSGKALVLLSGGIDSPVASYLTLKRGLKTRFVHFHSMPYTSKESVEKVVKLAEILKKFGSSGKIYLVPFAEIQKQIMIKCPEKFRIILYRRLMLMIAEKIARREKCKALITGDSLAQVASQTVENLFTVGQASNMLLLRPLISFDKEDIIKIARKIETYEISNLPHDDCCTRLMPKKPELRSNLEEILEVEKFLDISSLIEQALNKVEIKNI